MLPWKLAEVSGPGVVRGAAIRYNSIPRLTRDAEMLQDIHDYDEAKKAIEAGEELIPSEVTYAILDGENPIRVWREHRGFTQEQLARTAGISKAYLSQLECGKRKGTAKVLATLANALGIALDDLVELGSHLANGAIS